MRLDEMENRIVRVFNLSISEKKGRLGGESRALLLHSPLKKVSSLGQTISFQGHLLMNIMSKWLREKRMALSHFEEKITDINPHSLLNRGYSITRKLPEKSVVKSVSGLRVGDALNVLLSKGQLDCRIEKLINGNRRNNA